VLHEIKRTVIEKELSFEDAVVGHQLEATFGEMHRVSRKREFFAKLGLK
jgi:hypothetical protein